MAVFPERSIGSYGTDPSHEPTLYDHLLTQIREGEKRQATIPFGSYLQNVTSQLEKAASYNPIPHPGDIMFRAITAYPYFKDETRQEQYSFFTSRGKQHMVYGNSYQLGLIVTFMADRLSRIPGLGKALFLFAPTGAGKSKVVDALKAGYEDHSSREMQYTIAGCQYQDEPLLLLPKEARISLEQYKVSFAQELCDPCETKRRQAIDSETGILGVKLEPIEFSADRGVGLITIRPEMTESFNQPEVRDAILDRIRRANRGILEIAELFLHSPAFLKTLMGIIRERRLSYKGIEYHPQFIVLTHATNTDVARFNQLVSDKTIGIDSAAFFQRLTTVNIPYILSLSDEVALYQNSLAQSGYNLHISPQTLEMVGTVVLASRLIKSDIPGVDTDTKVEIYNGGKTDKFTQNDKRRIEEEGRQRKEGLSGISSVQMIELLTQALKENPRCINPLQTLNALERYISMQPVDYLRKIELLATIKNQRAKYEVLLERTVKQAFRGDHESACQKEFQYYLEQADAYLNGEKVYDHIRREYVKPDEVFMQQVEKIIGIGENAKKMFREGMLKDSVFINRQRDYAKNPVKYTELPKLKDAFERKITGISEQDIEDTILTLLNTPAKQQILLAVADQKKASLLQKAGENMIEQQGFCPDCTPQLLLQTAKVIHARTGKVITAAI